MNLYFLVEGKTEMELYPEWLFYLFPQLEKVDRYNQVIENQYYIASGDGYPSVLNNDYVKNAIQDINQYGKYDYLVLVIDSDGYSDRKATIEKYLIENDIVLQDCQLEIIVQNVCIETWLMGNIAAYPVDIQQNKNFLSYHQHYNVSENDPELMQSPVSKPSVSKYHFMYLAEMLKPNKRYSKTNVNNVSDLVYFEEMKKRVTTNTTHLNSFQAFISFCEKIKKHFHE